MGITISLRTVLRTPTGGKEEEKHSLSFSVVLRWFAIIPIRPIWILGCARETKRIKWTRAGLPLTHFERPTVLVLRRWFRTELTLVIYCRHCNPFPPHPTMVYPENIDSPLRERSRFLIKVRLANYGMRK